MKTSNLTLRGAIKAASVSGALLCAFLSVPANAGHISGPPPGPGFAQSGETCVLNRLGVGDCVIVGTVGDLSNPGYYPPIYTAIDSGSYQGYTDLEPMPPLVDSGTLPANGTGAFSSPAESLNSVSITGTSAVSVLGFGCTNASSAFDGSDPCYIDLAIGPGAVVANILQGELSYSYSTLTLGTGAFVQTGTGQALIASQISTASLASEQAYWAGATVEDGGPAVGGELWNVYSNTVGALGYNLTSTSVTGTYSVDPPLSEYLTPDVGGTYSGPSVDGSDGNQIGDSGVLNGVLFPGMSPPSSSVPEPTTLGLLGLGAIAAAFSRKRRGVVGV